MLGGERLKCHIISGRHFRQWSVGIGFLRYSACPTVATASSVPCAGRAVKFLSDLSSPGSLGILGL